jgi:hypothetical protein
MNDELQPQQTRTGVPSGYGQTAYKRELAYQRLGINPQDVERVPFLWPNLRGIARRLNRGRAEDAPLVCPLDLLHWSEDPEARRVLQRYLSVPESYRRLLPVEAYCYAAAVSPWRILELVAGVAVRLGAQASAILAAVWHPRVVEKTIEMALTDSGTVDRNTLHRATGFTPLPKGSTTIVNVQNAQGQIPSVPAPRPEDIIRRLEEVFNKAPQMLPATPVSDVVKLTSEEYEADDSNARQTRDPWG